MFKRLPVVQYTIAAESYHHPSSPPADRGVCQSQIPCTTWRQKEKKEGVDRYRQPYIYVDSKFSYGLLKCVLNDYRWRRAYGKSLKMFK